MSRGPYKLVPSGAKQVPMYRSLARGKSLYTVVYTLLGDNKRKRKSFSDEAEAIAFASSVETLQAQSGLAHVELYGVEAVIYRRAMEALKGTGMDLDEVVKEMAWAMAELKGRTVRKAVEYFVVACPAECKQITVAALVAEFLSQVEVSERTRGMYRGMGLALVSYLCREVRSGLLLSEVTRQHLSGWVGAGRVVSKTRKHRRALAVTLFRYAQAKDYLPQDKLTVAQLLPTVKLPRGGEAVPVFEPEDLFYVMEYCWQRRLQKPRWGILLLYLALGAYAGIRPDEVTFLDWRHIRFEEREIFIPDNIAKTGYFRRIVIGDNLWEFLKDYKGMSGPIFFKSVAQSVRRLYKQLGKQWPFDGLRHSYASYQSALGVTMEKLSDDMGNSRGVLQRCYRAPRTNVEAKKYFGIVPSAFRSLEAPAPLTTPVHNEV